MWLWPWSSTVQWWRAAAADGVLRAISCPLPLQVRCWGGEGGRDDGTIGTIITDYTASPVQRRSCHLVISEGQSPVFTSPSPASCACDADSCDNVGVFGGKMTPLSIVSTADYVPTLPLLMILYWCVTEVWNICWPTPQIPDTQRVPTWCATNSVICQCLPLLSIFIGSCVHKFKSAPRAGLCCALQPPRSWHQGGEDVSDWRFSAVWYYFFVASLCVGDIITDI